VSTRKLILTALACGMAILIAGSIQLLRLSSSDSSAAQVFKVGERATVSGVQVSVTEASAGNQFMVLLSQAEDPVLFDPLSDYWSLQVGNDDVAPSPSSSCSTDATAVAALETTCELSFEGSGGTRYLRFRKDGTVATWLITE
jgi:hypothetical protein